MSCNPSKNNPAFTNRCGPATRRRLVKKDFLSKSSKAAWLSRRGINRLWMELSMFIRRKRRAENKDTIH